MAVGGGVFTSVRKCQSVSAVPPEMMWRLRGKTSAGTEAGDSMASNCCSSRVVTGVPCGGLLIRAKQLAACYSTYWIFNLLVTGYA